MKRILVILLFLALLLSACQGGAATESAQLSPVPPASATAPATREAYAAATVAAPATDTPAPSGTPQVAEASPAAPAGCTVVSQKPNPTVESLFPRVSDDEWQQGPADAQVTIVEYGDFM